MRDGGGTIKLLLHAADVTNSADEKLKSTARVESLSNFDDRGQLWVARVGIATSGSPAVLWRIDQGSKELIELSHPDYGKGSYSEINDEGSTNHRRTSKKRSILSHATRPDSSVAAMVCQLWVAGGAGSNSTVLELWDLKTRKRIADWNHGGTEHGVENQLPSRSDDRVVAFSHDGKLLAVCSDGDLVSVWDANSLLKLSQVRIRERARLHGARMQNCICFTPDDRYIVYGSAFGTVAMIDAQSGEYVGWRCHEECIHAVAVNPGGTLIASGGQDQIVRLHEVPSGEEVASWKAHRAPITAVAFHSGGTKLVSGSENGVVRVWNLDGVVATDRDDFE